MLTVIVRHGHKKIRQNIKYETRGVGGGCSTERVERDTVGVSCWGVEERRAVGSQEATGGSLKSWCKKRRVAGETREEEGRRRSRGRLPASEEFVHRRRNCENGNCA